jgi:hypothetical protein
VDKSTDQLDITQIYGIEYSHKLPRRTADYLGDLVMGLSANEFRALARSCIKEADCSQDTEGKQMLLDIARLYTQTALHLESSRTSSLVQSLVAASSTPVK